MSTELIIELPEFDTGQYEDCEFVMAGGDARLTLRFSELPAFGIGFSRARWHQFTALPNCSVEMIKTAYFQLVELKDSSTLAAFIRRSGGQEGISGIASLSNLSGRNRLSRALCAICLSADVDDLIACDFREQGKLLHM